MIARYHVAVSRRIFLQQGVLAAAACATTPLLALGSQRPTGGDRARELPSHRSSGSSNWQDHASAFDHLGRSNFTNTIGTDFKVTVPGSTQPVWVTLLAVEDLPALPAVNPASFAVASKQSSSAPTTSGFVLRFGGSTPLSQGTYLFQHDALGLFALFAVPQGNGRQVYNAIVNRLDGATIVAVPFDHAPQAGAPASTPVAPATSSTTENPPRALSQSPAARRAAVRD